MDIRSDHSGGPVVGLPFTRPLVRRFVEELFRDQSQWKSGDLVNRVVQLHRAKGGAAVSSPQFTIKRVLQDLRNEGMVIALGHGWWRWTGGTSDGLANTDREAIPAEPTVSVNDAADDLEPTIRIDKEIGVGSECVYLYFNPNDRRLAELEGRNVWECKIGRTSCDAVNRILGQGIRTALSRLPTVGLVVHTDDSSALENALHSSLRLVGAEVPDSPGNEWFITSSARVEAWYAMFEKGLAEIRPSQGTSG